MMWTVIWTSLLLASGATVILRIAGRKSISQMSVPQVAILLSIGAILGSDVGGEGAAHSLLAAATFIGFLVAVEWISLHWNGAETLLNGKSIVVIEDGKLNLSNLSKLRLSVDDLEKRLRLAGVSRFEDVAYGTIETNGELGYELKPHAKPVTMGDLEQILLANFPEVSLPGSDKEPHTFTEVTNGKHQKPVPRHLH